MARRSLGTELKIGTTTIGNLTSLNGVEVTAETIDVTTFDSTDGYREFINGFIDGGEVTAEGYLSDAATDEVAAAGLVGGASASCTISFPAVGGSGTASTWSFTGIVTGFGTGADVDGAVTFSITIKVSGKPVFSAGT